MTKRAPLARRVVTSLEEFKGLAEPWQQLLNTVPGHGMFLTWEWLYCWAKHFLQDSRLRILLMLNGQGRLVGIVPLYLRATRAQGLISCREFRFLGSETVCSSYLDVIADEAHKRAVLQALYHYLFEEARREWDILTFAELPAESSTVDLWNELCDEAGKVGEVLSTTCCPVIQLPKNIETYRAGLGRSRRYTLQRKMTRLQSAGRVEFSSVINVPDVDRALESLITLHQRRWSDALTSGVFANARSERFHREMVQVLSDRGRVNINLLRLDGQPIAAIYGFVYDAVYYFYLPGFDPMAVPKASPGSLLLYHRIEQAIQDGARMVDLLQGAQPYKLEWSSSRRRLLTVRYYNRHPRAAVLKLLEGATQVIKLLLR